MAVFNMLMKNQIFPFALSSLVLSSVVNLSFKKKKQSFQQAEILPHFLRSFTVPQYLALISVTIHIICQLYWLENKLSDVQTT